MSADAEDRVSGTSAKALTPSAVYTPRDTPPTNTSEPRDAHVTPANNACHNESDNSIPSSPQSQSEEKICFAGEDVETTNDMTPSEVSVSLSLPRPPVSMDASHAGLLTPSFPTSNPRVPITGNITTTTTATLTNPPIDSAFSTSSRGNTSMTALSTSSSASSTADSSSTNQTRTRSNMASALGSKDPTPLVPARKSATGTVSGTGSSGNVIGGVSGGGAVGGATAPPPVDRIDSALLSALCDPRERKGLLRLEQVLIDFMNERHTGFIEVGGPNNSIVMGGTRSREGEEGRGRQTSFQRLCLHRLADRFNIVRESASPYFGGEGGGFESGSGPGPGLIRLVKVKSSRIPSNLLIDLDVEKIEAAREEEGLKLQGITDNLAQTNLTAAGDVVVVGRKGQQPRKKMMIMKRGKNASNNSDRDLKFDKQGGSRSSIKGKNLSDKEKAYAEARARIFKDEAEIQSQNTPEHALEPSTPPLSQRFSTTSSTRSTSPATSTTPSYNPDPPSANTTFNETSLPVEPPISAIPDDQDDPSPSKTKKDPTTNPPLSKVIWRNRRQEENDPDFRRGVVRPSNPSTYHAPPMSYAAPPFMVAGPGPNPGNPSSSHPYDGSVGWQHATKGYHHQQPVFYQQAGPVWNGGGGGRFPMPQQQQQQQPGVGYYAHGQSQQHWGVNQSQDHQAASRGYHQRVGNGRNYVVGNTATGGHGIHQNHMFYNGPGGSAQRRGSGTPVYSMEEFPALR